MARFCGKIGYSITEESTDNPGVWVENIIEKTYYGDITRNTSSYRPSNKVNDDISVENVISIVADPYACHNFQHMRYVIYMGSKWKINHVEVLYPRILLNIGGLYNE